MWDLGGLIIEVFVCLVLKKVALILKTEVALIVKHLYMEDIG